MAQLADTGFREVVFLRCKLIGLHFEDCNAYSLDVRFDACQLDLSAFFKRSLKGMAFENCSLKEVDFVEADLTEARFHNCDLTGAMFENSLLEKADFRTATNFSIDPEMNRLQKARFSRHGLHGLLHKYNIQIEE